MAQPATSGLTSEDRKKIEALTERFIETMLGGDLDGATRMYADDAVLMPPNHPSVRGRAEIRAFLESFPKITRFSARNEEVDGRGDLAYVRGTYSMTLQAESGETVDDEGKYLEVRKRQADGSWPCIVDTFSSDKEPMG